MTEEELNAAALAAGLDPKLVQGRLSKGWSVERALSTPKMSCAQAGKKGGRKSPWAAWDPK